MAIAKAVEETLADRPKGRPKEGKESPQNFAEFKSKKTAEIAAERAGFGNKETYRQSR